MIYLLHNGRTKNYVTETDRTILVVFMEGHKNFAIGQVRSKEGQAISARLWQQCAEILNAEGVTRTPKDWSKFWNDYKCRVRAKVTEINRGFRATGSGPSSAPVLTPLEERVAALLGRDVGPLTGVRQDPEIQIKYINNTDEMDVEQEVTLRASNSPILDLNFTQDNAGAVGNISPADVSRTATLETPAESQQTDAQEEAVEIQPASRGPTPPPGRSRNREPRQARPRRGAARPRSVHQSNMAALDEARATIARIEEMRARTEEITARGQLNTSAALTSMAESMSSMAESISSMAETMRNYLSLRLNPSS